jgi:hypothetical protein
VVVRYVPFAIRLKDRLLEDSTIAGVAVRVDPGSCGTGIVVTTDTEQLDHTTGHGHSAHRGLFAVELNHRGAQIRDGMKRRAGYRRRRRSGNPVTARPDSTAEGDRRAGSHRPCGTGSRARSARSAATSDASPSAPTGATAFPPGGHAGTSHKNLRLLQRADGYAYGTRFEKPVEPRSISS